MWRKYGRPSDLEVQVRAVRLIETANMTGTSFEEEFAPRIRYEIRGELALRSKAGSLLYAVCLVIAAYITGIAQAHFQLFAGTFLVLLLVGVYRTRLVLKLEDTESWDRAFFLSCLALSGTFGALVAYLTLFYGVGEVCYLWLLISIGLCAGATSTLAPDLQILRTVQTTLMFPTVGALFWLATPESVSLSGLSLLYCLYLIAQGSALHRGFMSSRKAQIRLELKSQQLEEASRVKSDFLANVSHEIRTPMNGVLGMTEEVLMTDLSSEQRDDLCSVRDSAKSLLAVINQILDFSKIEAGMLPRPVSEEFELDGLIPDCLRPFSVTANKRGLAFFYEIAPELPGRMRGDPGRVRQILTNLVGNSMKFTEKGHVCVQVEQGEKGPRFTVRDTGGGIAEEKIDTIFEPFSQADSSLTRGHQGTGLGLSIVRQLVESLEGEIEINSELGKGTVFTFECPQLQSVNELDKPLRGLELSLCDDLESRRLATLRLLERWGATVEPCSVSVALEGKQLLLEGDNVSPQALETLASKNIIFPLFLGPSKAQLPQGVSALSRPLRLSQVAEALESAKPAQISTEVTTGEPEDTVHKRVLLAEDQEINQELACRMLQRMGFEVAVANNGQEAVDRFRQERFDLVLMDVQMPIMDGYQATAMIRALDGGGAVPIVAVTAHAIEGDAEKCLSAGMDAYLSKPINRRKFKETLDSLLRGQPQN